MHLKVPSLTSVLLLVLVLLILLVGCQSTPIDEPATPAQATEAPSAPEPASKPPASEFSLGNGQSNWIIVEGLTRTGRTFTFSEVQIDGNGWLVLHPFEDGRPVGDRYVGSTYITSGDNRAVKIQVDHAPETGDQFIVMLHRDANENREFDFVFVDERNVLDKAVFEGRRMIAHQISAP